MELKPLEPIEAVMPYENLSEAQLLRALKETGEGIAEAARSELDIVEGRLQMDATTRETVIGATVRTLDRLRGDYEALWREFRRRHP
jgi:hypothetical protein